MPSVKLQPQTMMNFIGIFMLYTKPKYRIFVNWKEEDNICIHFCLALCTLTPLIKSNRSNFLQNSTKLDSEDGGKSVEIQLFRKDFRVLLRNISKQTTSLICFMSMKIRKHYRVVWDRFLERFKTLLGYKTISQAWIISWRKYKDMAFMEIRGADGNHSLPQTMQGKH